MKHAAVAALLTAITFAGAPALADGITKKPLGTTPSPFGYVEYLPPGYDAAPSEKHPIVVFYSGIDELGDGSSKGLDKVLHVGVLKAIENGLDYFATHRAIVIQPQAPDQWMFGPQLEDMPALFNHLKSAYRVDLNRVYLTGLSSGGGGVYAFVGNGGAKKAGVAAVIPICGNSDAYPSMLPPFEDMPMWSFQNWGDPVNPRRRPIDFTNGAARQKTGSTTLDLLANYAHQDGDPAKPSGDTRTAIFDVAAFTWEIGRVESGPSELRLTLNSSSSHDAWTSAYADPKVWGWMFRHGAPRADDAGAPDGGAGDGGDVDAGIVSGEGGPSAPSPSGDDGAETSAEEGGCSVAGAPATLEGSFVLAGLALLLRRRRR